MVNMLHIEKMTTKDFPYAVDLANTMDWNMTDADFEFNMKMEPNGCFVLKDNSKPIGVATCISYGKIGWFGNLIVEQAYRKQGAGSRLVKHAIDYLKSVDVTTVGLYAYQHLTKFYGNIGFQSNVDFTFLKAQSISSVTFPKKVAKLTTLTQKNIPRIIEFDAGCFGAERGKLLKTILKNKNNLCYVVEESGKVVGFVAAKVYDGLAEVGPMAYSNSHTEFVELLLSSILLKLKGSEAYLCMPSSNMALLALADKFGFKEEFKLTRMFLGAPIQTDCIYFAESLERG
jgi:N-acetylglutamate synthase-like GNAT family acetyltransferase